MLNNMNTFIYLVLIKYIICQDLWYVLWINKVLIKLSFYT